MRNTLACTVSHSVMPTAYAERSICAFVIRYIYETI